MNPDTNPGVHIRERRLAAIMFTDVTGYSARTQRDEEGTLDLVGADLRRITEICNQQGGEVLTTMGDGMLICFTSTVRAVSCALQIQAEFAARKETMPAEQCLDHRIGIHLGDIFVRDGNVAGDGVNIAARLQTKAPPGGICISQTVHDTVKGKLAMQSVFIGPQSFKNIAEPIPVYQLSPEGAPNTVPPIAPVPAGKGGWFIRRKPGGRTSLTPAGWAVAATGVTAIAVGLALALRPRPAAPPASTAPVVAAQPSPAPTPAPTAVPTPTPAPAKAEAPVPANPSAAQARSFFMAEDARRPDYMIAENLLTKAVAADPTDAAAWAAYSELDSAFIRNNFDRRGARLEGAQTMAERALKLAPDSSEALIALGQSERLFGRNLPGAEQAFRLALNKEPSNGELMRELAETLRAEGKLQEAVDLYGRAGTLLVKPAEIGCEEARTLFDMRRFKEAEATIGMSLGARVTAPAVAVQALLDLTWHGNADRAALTLARLPPARKGDEEAVFLEAYSQLLARNPQDALATLTAYPGVFFPGPLFFGPKAYLTGLAHSRLNDAAKAQADWEAGLADVHRRIQATPKNALLHLSEGLLLASLGKTDEALRDARAAANRPQQAGFSDSWMEDPAVIFCAIGHEPEAINRIERLVSSPSVWPLTPQLLRLDPLWDPLREKPRFKRLVSGGATGD